MTYKIKNQKNCPDRERKDGSKDICRCFDVDFGYHIAWNLYSADGSK